MKFKIGVILVLVMLLVMPMIVSVQGMSTSNLALAIQTNKDVYSPGEDVEISFSISNLGSGTFALADEYRIYLEVVDTDDVHPDWMGTQVWSTLDYGAPEGLSPGETYENTVSWQVPQLPVERRYRIELIVLEKVGEALDPTGTRMVPVLDRVQSVEKDILVTDFSITIEPKHVKVPKEGGSVNYTIDVSAVEGFDSPIEATITVTGPGGFSETYALPTQHPPYPKTYTYIMDVSSGTPPGTYTATLTATGEGLTRTESTTLVMPGFGVVFAIAGLLAVAYLIRRKE